MQSLASQISAVNFPLVNVKPSRIGALPNARLGSVCRKSSRFSLTDKIHCFHFTDISHIGMYAERTVPIKRKI